MQNTVQTLTQMLKKLAKKPERGGARRELGKRVLKMSWNLALNVNCQYSNILAKILDYTIQTIQVVIQTLLTLVVILILLTIHK